jgi:alkylated DNA repair dioxygenase AlkB
VPQIPLFDSSEAPAADRSGGVLADDERGSIVYTARFVEAAAAAAWFDALRGQVEWKAERRRMYDREVEVPRLTAHFRLSSGDPPPEAIVEAARRVVSATGVPFNAVGLNLYRDGRDSVAPHNDHLYEIVEGHPIGLLSLGATRRMTIRSKEPPRRVLKVDLEAGSLLMMSYATQLHYTHGVPKTRAAVGERISLAFRVKPEGPARRGDRYR